MGKTKIEWCDYTINPVIGCSKCSPGCENCYAEKFAARLAKNPATAKKYSSVVSKTGEWNRHIVYDLLNPLAGLPKKPRKQGQRVFVCSMGDLFHDDMPYGIIGSVYRALKDQPYIFLLLTKRPENMQEVILGMVDEFDDNPLPNVWLGVSVCNDEEALRKIPPLLDTPAAKRFVSIEPMLGPIDISPFVAKCGWVHQQDFQATACLKNPWRPSLDWVICGGETGPGAREMKTAWAESLHDKCADEGNPFFFKGWGPKARGRLICGHEHNEAPK